MKLNKTVKNLDRIALKLARKHSEKQREHARKLGKLHREFFLDSFQTSLKGAR